MVKIDHENLFILFLKENDDYYTFAWNFLSKDPSATGREPDV